MFIFTNSYIYLIVYNHFGLVALNILGFLVGLFIYYYKVYLVTLLIFPFIDVVLINYYDYFY